jgi:hypothetical protein
MMDDCGGCQYWDGATCMCPMSKRYGRDTDDGCDKWDGGQDDDRA